MKFYLDAVYIGIIAYVYACILTEPGMILNKFYQTMNRLPEWLFNPLIGCVYCVAGQISLWYFIIVYSAPYSLIDHILFISTAILTTEIVLSIINKLNK